ncbi:MAG: FAD-linked oxidase C-terminal domain-containing protein, partial [Desulfobacterales bacterium]
AVLIVEVEGLSAGLKDQVSRISELCRKNRCRDIREAKDDDQRNRLWEGRRGAFGAVARLAPNYLVNDCTVPRTKLPEALARVAEIVAKYDFKHGNVFHAGDGNLHPLIFFDSRDDDQLKRVKKAGWEIMEACVALGGTISGEHGVGLEKIEAMRLVFSELDFVAQRGLQQAFDPDGLLNPGKVIPLSAPEENTDEARARLQFTGAAASSAIEKEISETIRSAAAGGTGLMPAGGGTFPHFGNMPTRKCQNLSSSALNEIIEFDPYNQFVTAGAGIALDVLQHHLAKDHQWLPVRPSFSVQDHSLGGVMARAACGPERMHYGAPRDLVLGLRFLDGSGQKISTGGKVVKNVAGYDMTRLVIGSAGTLGLITEVTCRTMTIPERCSAIGAEGPLSACADLASAVITSQLIPVFIVMMPANGQGDEVMHRRCELKVGFEGFDKTVTEQLARTQELFEKADMRLSPVQDYSIQDGILRSTYAQQVRAAFILRADLPLDRMPGFVESLDGRLPESKLLLDYGCGRILAAFENIPDGIWHRLCETGAQLGGHVVMEKATAEFKENNDVFGIDRPEWKLMHRIKAALDPQHVFSPGRLPGKV